MTFSKTYKVDDMRKLLLEAALELPEPSLNQLWLYHRLLRKANPSLNLSRIYNFENMVRKHYIDSLFVHKIFKEKSIPLPSPLLDIGSGPGLPGIPLAICLPQTKFILAESRQMRADFLEDVVQRLALKNTDVHKHSISKLRCPPIGAAITRALEKMPESLNRIERALPSGGLCIFMKGPRCDEEIQSVQEQSHPFQLLLDEAYTLPNSKDHRRLVLWEKSKTVAASHIHITPRERTLIESPANPHFKSLYKLRQSRHIKKQAQSLVCGTKLVLEFLQKYPQRAKALISFPEDTKEKKTNQIKIETEKACEGLPSLMFSRILFKELDFMGTGSPLLLVDIPLLNPLPLFTPQKEKRLPIHVFLALGNPENLGAALRSCAAFNVEAVILLQEASHPFHPKAIRAAAGHNFSLPLYDGLEGRDSSLKNLRDILLEKDGPCLVLDPRGEPIDKLSMEMKGSGQGVPLRLLLGSEGQGLASPLPPFWKKVSIPMAPGVESLNTTVSLSIMLYIISQQWIHRHPAV